MVFAFKPYTIIFFAGALLSLAIGIFIWRRRPAPGAAPFALFNFAIFAWAILWFLETGAAAISDKIIWAKLEYFGIILLGPLWLLFTLDFTGRRQWRNDWRFLLLFLVPLATFILVGTNDWHHLFWTQIYYYSSPNFGRVVIYEHGLWFWVSSLYQYTLIVLGIVLLWIIRSAKHSQYRKQVIALTTGALIPVFLNLIYILKIRALDGLDLTPFSLAFTTLMYTITIFRYHLLDIREVAKNTLVEQIPVGIILVNAENIVIEINSAAERMSGLRKEKTFGNRLPQVWKKLDRVKSSLKSGQHREIAAEESGTGYDLDVSLTDIYDRNRVIAGQLIMFQDITERCRMERAIRESEKRYSTLVEQSNDGILIVKLGGTILFANQTLSTITGYTREELIGQKTLLILQEEDSFKLRDFTALRKENKPIPDSIEIRLIRKDGQIRDADVALGPLTYEGNQVAIVTIRDITDRKITQKKLEALYNQEKDLRRNLQEEIANRTKYTRALVHELKTPLTAILSSSELLEFEVQDELLMSLVQNIRQASLNLEYRTNELLDLARGETGNLKMQIDSLDLKGLINEIVSRLTPSATQKGLCLKAEIGDIPLIQGDKERLRIVLENLLNNAINYSEIGGVTIEAKDHDDTTLLIQVRDTGRGIEPEQMKDLFDPYRRKSTEGQKYSGIGVGLALCRIYIELHQGKIWAESVPGQGTTIYIALPISKASGPQKKQPDPGIVNQATLS